MSESAAGRFIEKRGGIVLFLLALALLLPGSNGLPLLDRDEPRFAQATVEMIQRHEWIVPYFNGEYRFDKPVLTYWLMRAGYALFGVNETGARFHSILAAALLAVAVYWMGRRWLGARAGFLAGFGLLTCFQTAVHGRSAVADMPMVLFVCLAMWAMAELLDIPSPGAAHNRATRSAAGGRPASPWPWFWLFYLSLGLGFLAKGPIALIVPLLGALLWRFVFWRRAAPWRNLRLHLGIPVTLAIMGAWGIPALLKTGGLFWKVGMGEHVVDRGMRAFNGRLPFPFYYVFTLFLSLFPWCLCIRDAWRAGRGRLAGGLTPLDAWLVSWFLAPFAVFSLYSTQLPHYIMPGFPAFFLLLARAWNERHATGPDRANRRLIPVGMAAGLAFVVAVLVMGCVLRPRTPALQLQSFLSGLPEQTVCGYHRFREPSLVFYSGRRFTTLGKMDNVLAFMQEDGPRLLITEVSSRKILGSRADDYTADLARIPTNGCAMVRVDGLRVAQGREVTVLALFKP